MPTVQLFITCLCDTFYPEVGEAIVDVLSRLSVSVDFAPDQTCCGQPAFNAGLRADARKMAEHMIEAFERPVRSLETSQVLPDIVSPSGSCVHMLRVNYPELFADNPAWLARAKSLAARTFEFSEYLVDKLGVTDVGAHWDGTLTYHPSCHLSRGLGIDRQPRALLSAVKGAQIVELPHADECCGFGGIFSVVHPEVSKEMLLKKIENLEASQSPTLVIPDAGCLMHIAGGLHRMGKGQRAVHLAEVLAGK
ncbi:MAG: (Fe-S)-binding protein [Chloroflexi bacterium]|nr:(Fe-S)-binding protein [Chloroflexota bacterium]